MDDTSKGMQTNNTYEKYVKNMRFTFKNIAPRVFSQASILEKIEIALHISLPGYTCIVEERNKSFFTALHNRFRRRPDTKVSATDPILSQGDNAVRVILYYAIVLLSKIPRRDQTEVLEDFMSCVRLIQEYKSILASSLKNNVEVQKKAYDTLLLLRSIIQRIIQDMGALEKSFQEKMDAEFSGEDVKILLENIRYLIEDIENTDMVEQEQEDSETPEPEETQEPEDVPESAEISESEIAESVESTEFLEKEGEHQEVIEEHELQEAHKNEETSEMLDGMEDKGVEADEAESEEAQDEQDDVEELEEERQEEDSNEESTDEDPEESIQNTEALDVTEYPEDDDSEHEEEDLVEKEALSGHRSHDLEASSLALEENVASVSLHESLPSDSFEREEPAEISHEEESSETVSDDISLTETHLSDDH